MNLDLGANRRSDASLEGMGPSVASYLEIPIGSTEMSTRFHFDRGRAGPALLALLTCACAADGPARTAGTAHTIDSTQTAHISADPAQTADATSLEYLANEGVILWDGGRGVAIDALFGDGLPEYPTVAPATRDSLERALGRFGGIELVLVTHVHRDHFDAAAVGRHLFANPRARLVAPAQVVDSLTAKVPGAAAFLDRIQALDFASGATFDLPTGAESDPTLRALGIPHPPSRNQPVQHVVYLVQLAGERVIHLGDSRPAPEDLIPLLEHGGPDLLLAPWWILTGDEGARLLESVGAHRVAGFHLARGDEPRVAHGVVLLEHPAVTPIRFPE